MIHFLENLFSGSIIIFIPRAVSVYWTVLCQAQSYIFKVLRILILAIPSFLLFISCGGSSNNSRNDGVIQSEKLFIEPQVTAPVSITVEVGSEKLLIEPQVTAPVSITVEVGNELGSVNRGVFGTGMVGYHTDPWKVDHYVDGAGVWDPIANRSVPEMIDLASNLKISYVRFPGGGGVHEYDWKATVGPIDLRPIIRNGTRTTFGLPEFLQNSDDMGTVPIITISDFTGTAEDAADIVRYLNSPCNAPECTTTPDQATCSIAYSNKNWPQIRVCDKKALGRTDLDKPWNIVWFEYGNESFDTNFIPFFTPIQYVSNYHAYRKIMKSVDTSIKLGAILEWTPFTGWNSQIIKGTGSIADFFVVHLYVPWYPKDFNVPSNDLFRLALAGVDLQLKTKLQQYNDLIHEHTGRSVPLAITEFNGGFTIQEPVPYRHSLGNALVIAEFIRQFMHAENILMANYHQFANSWWGIIESNNASYTLRPNYYTYYLYNNHFGEVLINARVDCTSLNQGDCTYSTSGGYEVLPNDNVPYITANASKSIDGAKVYIMVTNKHLTDALNVTITINDFKPKYASARTLNGKSVESHNENDINVTVSRKDIELANSVFTISFPPHSLTAIELK